LLGWGLFANFVASNDKGYEKGISFNGFGLFGIGDAEWVYSVGREIERQGDAGYCGV
jgi:hypothetical protein